MRYERKVAVAEVSKFGDMVYVNFVDYEANFNWQAKTGEVGNPYDGLLETPGNSDNSIMVTVVVRMQ